MQISLMFQRMLLQFRQIAPVERVVEEEEGCECIFFPFYYLPLRDFCGLVFFNGVSYVITIAVLQWDNDTSKLGRYFIFQLWN